MQNVYVENYADWREKARALLNTNTPPYQVTWSEQHVSQLELFNRTEQNTDLVNSSTHIVVPKSFLALAETVACHRDGHKWQKLYEMLWRLTHGEKNLLAISSDPLTRELSLLAKAVKRDAHKMKAFVRFRCYEIDSKNIYIAFHQPDHHIIKRVTPFFVHRFGVMHWIIVTPDETAVWNGEQLHFLPGNKDFSHAGEDKLEDLWRTYYRAIFNPARVKISAMVREMPVRYWHNLPETAIIKDMLTEAPQRVATMLKHTAGLADKA